MILTGRWQVDGGDKVGVMVMVVQALIPLDCQTIDRRMCMGMRQL